VTPGLKTVLILSKQKCLGSEINDVTQISYTPIIRVFNTKFLINMPNNNIISREIINLKISETGNDIILAE
jgi:hypothetical protein